MKKPPIRTLISRTRAALKTVDPRSRDRVRRRLNVLLMTARLRKESRAA